MSKDNFTHMHMVHVCLAKILKIDVKKENIPEI